MAQNKVQHVDSHDQLQKLFSSTTFVVVDFYADWCGQCKAIAPLIESLAAKHGMPSFLAFAKVDVDRAQDAARAYNVSAMPTFLFFKHGTQVAVNGQAVIRGADARALAAAAEKLGSLAKKRADEAGGGQA